MARCITRGFTPVRYPRAVGTTVSLDGDIDIHHLLSDYERDCYFIFCWDERVLDIRERFPLLPIRNTKDALQFGIRPPMNPATGQYMVMTSDFRLTIKRGNSNVDVIRTFIPKQELEARRVKDKFRIEQTFWEAAGVEWGSPYRKRVTQSIRRRTLSASMGTSTHLNC